MTMPLNNSKPSEKCAFCHEMAVLPFATRRASVVLLCARCTWVFQGVAFLLGPDATAWRDIPSSESLIHLCALCTGLGHECAACGHLAAERIETVAVLAAVTDL